MDAYRALPTAERFRVARRASPELRLHLARVERDMALDRSPGALAAVLTGGKEMQAPHLDIIDRIYQRIDAGERIRAMVTMPPRAGKSRRTSRWGPAWYLRKQPDHRFMLASYAAHLADDHGRWVRNTITEHAPTLGINLKYGSQAANRFDIEGHEGGMVTAGVGGALTGRGAHVAAVDDPFKGSEDASSPTQRERVWDWWQSVLLTRLEPNGSVLLVNTRWDDDDLSGRLLKEEPEDWIVIDLPAIALTADDPLGRQPGEALWPSRFNVDDYARIRKSVGERVWWALYQQQPRPLEGGVWQWAWITGNRVSRAQFLGIDLSRVVVAIDPSGGAGTANDETGIVAAGRTSEGHYYVTEDRSGRHGANAWGREACLLAVELKADALVVETNFGGDMTRQVLIQAWNELERQNLTQGMPMPRIVEVNAKQGKRLRAEPIAQLYEQSLVHHVGEWPALENQMVTWIPGMDSPDRMDAAVHALTELADPASARVGSTSYTDRRLQGRR
ncbi:terminase large subunit domain-containing protein [Streptomyces sp. 8L]|uniref:terminase large subunit domain-containing protein n=1 Tax=Streptomyces sp. 8L TaxID=2877242 RepID=UPI001CD6553A|nr:terminase family protein [Streptomyces sp. 8L]MCA1223466.1 terminase family protein [Streptomyces sp. 8L]